jgi:ABC-type branched-subunit amino acid transport system ATPase component
MQAAVLHTEHLSRSFGIVTALEDLSLEVIGSRDAIETVKIGGSAVMILQGELLL